MITDFGEVDHRAARDANRLWAEVTGRWADLGLNLNLELTPQYKQAQHEAITALHMALVTDYRAASVDAARAEARAEHDTTRVVVPDSTDRAELLAAIAPLLPQWAWALGVRDGAVYVWGTRDGKDEWRPIPAGATIENDGTRLTATFPPEVRAPGPPPVFDENPSIDAEQGRRAAMDRYTEQLIGRARSYGDRQARVKRWKARSWLIGASLVAGTIGGVLGGLIAR